MHSLPKGLTKTLETNVLSRFNPDNENHRLGSGVIRSKLLIFIRQLCNRKFYCIIRVEVCDLLGDCTQQEIKIEVIGDLNIYTGISPNGDIYNEVWIIKNIEILHETKTNKVSVYNR